MGLWQLRLSLLGTLAMIIGLSTLFFTAVLFFVFQTIDLVVLGVFVVGFNIVQWLISPYLIGLMYRVKEVSRSEKPKLHEIVERLSAKSGLKKPRVMVANLPIPNAFAYSSPIAGSRVAVTSELLNTLNDNEVEAVIGHELGHLKHHDVGVMMFVSILPALFYYLGYSTLFSSMYGSRDDRGSSGGAAAIGAVSLVMYFVLTLFTLRLSRIREYFADRHSASIVDNGANRLSTGLIKIVNYTSRMKQNRRNTGGTSSFKALFISDPDRASADQAAISQSVGYQNEQNMVNELIRKNVTTWDKVAELLSTHPNIIKRLRALQELD